MKTKVPIKQDFGPAYEQARRNGWFGQFGGCYSPEVLVPTLHQLEQVYADCCTDNYFKQEYHRLLQEYAGRPSRLSFAERLSQAWGGADIYLKREDLNHTGSHKINNALGQALLARAMNKKRLIAETGAGQHGVATATVAAHFGFQCRIYMGAEDVRRQKLNCFRMELLGAELVPVSSGTKTLKDATNEAMRDWSANVEDTHYVIGSVIGPHPFPNIVRSFQSVIGSEARQQILDKSDGSLPDAVIACVGGGSNAIGIFSGFLSDPAVRLIGIEAGGRSQKPGDNSASISFGKIGYFHGTRSLYIQKDGGQIEGVHSVSAGLDYPGVGPEHAHLWATKRAEYYYVSDKQALEAFQEVTKLEGILPALETAHSFAYARQLAKELGTGAKILVCLSGRGDKDVAEIARLLGHKF